MPEIAPRLTLLGRWIAACQPYWRAGMENDPLPDPPIAMREGALEAMRSTSLDALAVFPTHVGRPVAEARETLCDYAAQLTEAARSLNLRIGLVVGVQYRDPGKVEAARAFIVELLRGLPEGLAFVEAMLLCSRIKPDTLNAAYEIAQSSGARWQLWIDDDVTLADGAMTALLAAAEAHREEDIWTFGLRRTAIRSENWLSKLNALRRRHARGQLHPFGCSMLVRTSARVWPILRWSDDTWLAARVIDPVAPVAFHRSLVVDSHDVRYGVPEGLRYAWSRIRRIHANQIMTLAELDPLQGQRYVTSAMFGGIFGRGGGLSPIPGVLLSLGMQSLAISLWFSRAHWIALRGLLRWPVKRPPWAVGDKYLRPGA